LSRYLARHGGSLHAIAAVGVPAFKAAPAPTSSTATIRARRTEILDMALSLFSDELFFGDATLARAHTFCV
jgi:hypothetical protein